MKSKIENRKSAIRNTAAGLAAPTLPVSARKIARLRSASSLTSGALEQTNPLRGLTLARAVSLMESTLRGEYAQSQWTLWHVEQSDPDLFALESRRSSALMEMDWGIKIIDQKSEVRSQKSEASLTSKVLAADQAATLRAAYERIDNLNDAIEDMSLAFVHGFSIAQFESSDASIDHQPSTINHLGSYDPWNIVRHGMSGDFYFNPEGRSVSWKTLGEENRIDPANHLIFTPRKNLMRIALYKFIRSNLSQKDWDAFIEIYGLPSVFIIGPPNVPLEKEAQYETAAKEAAEGGSGYVPNGSDVKFANEARGGNPFRDHLEYLQAQLILAGTGGLLTMLSQPTGIGPGATGAHEDTFRTIARGEAKKISEVFQKQFDKKILGAAFPGKPILAYFEIASQEEQDTGEIIKHALELSQAGFAMDPAELSEKTGYKISVSQPSPAGAGNLGLALPLPSARERGGQSTANAQTTSRTPAAHQERGKRTPASAISSNQRSNVGLDLASSHPSVADAVAQTIGIRSEWLQPFFSALEAKAQDGSLTDAELLDAIETMAKSLPELMTEASLQDTAAIVQKTLTAALIAEVAGQKSKVESLK